MLLKDVCDLASVPDSMVSILYPVVVYDDQVRSLHLCKQTAVSPATEMRGGNSVGGARIELESALAALYTVLV